MKTKSLKRITTRDSSGVGISRVIKGLEVSTVAIRWKLISVWENCGVMIHDLIGNK
jgi:hypothetical protein